MQCCEALDRLISTIVDDPAFTTPDPEHPFKLETDTLYFAVEAVLF